MPSKKTKTTPKPKSRSQTPNHNHTNSHTDNPSSLSIETLSPKTQIAFQNALEDVHTRFILNLPSDELASSNRLFFQIEQAWWFYEDFICDEMDEIESDTNENNITATPIKKKTKKSIDYPRFSNLKSFAKTLCSISPILSPSLLPSFETFWKEFTNYKRKISTYGTILLNKSCDQIILCQDYKSKCWTIPAGKVNQNEKGMDAAVRETYEETGFDIGLNFGLTKLHYYDDGITPTTVTSSSTSNSSATTAQKYTWSKLSEDDSLTYVENDGSGKRRTCYICHGVPDDFPFSPVVRKEIADVQWHDLDNLPKKTFAVLPFMKDLRRWIRKHHNHNSGTSTGTSGGSVSKSNRDSSSTKKQRNSSNKKEKQRSGSTRSQRSGGGGGAGDSNKKGRSISIGSERSLLVTSEDDDLVQSGLSHIGESNRWSEEDMFRTNEELIGRKIEYDGNPQQFATKGFDGIDPHAFRIVGGQFMNSGNKDIANAPDRSIMQPLFRKKYDHYNEEEEEDGDQSDDDNDDGDVGEDTDDDLKPFFSDDGVTPWGEKVFEEKRKKKKERRTQPSSDRQKSEYSTSDTNNSVSSIPSASDFEEYLLNNDNSHHDSNSNENKDVNESDDYAPSKSSESKKKLPGLAILAMLRGGDDTDKDVDETNKERVIPASALDITIDEVYNNDSNNDDNQNNNHDEAVDIFMTDKEIKTGPLKKKNQKESKSKEEDTKPNVVLKESYDRVSNNDVKSYEEHEHWTYLKQWVNNLPQSEPSKHFRDFRFDVDAIMSAVMNVK